MLDISVVIPVLNGERYIEACLESVMASTVPPREILVVDDGSEDNTQAIVRKFPQARLLAQAHRGASTARNRGVREASAAWIAFLDADDLMTPNRLECQSRMLLDTPDLGGVFGQVEQFSDPPGAFPCDPRRQQAKLTGALTVRRDLFDWVGGFDESFRAAEFIDWVLRAEDKGAVFGTVDELVLRRRIHSSNLGRVQTEARQDYARVVMAALLRRRAGQ